MSNKPGTIRCQCGKVVFDGLILKMRVGQFSMGYFNMKCPGCKTWLNGIPVGILIGEIKEDIDFSKSNKEVFYDAQTAHS